MYRLDWDGGAGAIVDVFRSGTGESSSYRRRYISPFQRTMRGPAVPVQITRDELKAIDRELRRFAGSIGLGGRGDTVVGVKNGDISVLERLADVGGLLFDLVLPAYARNDLRNADIFLEIGTDELLLGYPWELMHDAGQFLCLHHHIGRFVNLLQTPAENTDPSLEGQDHAANMNVLLISVPAPKHRDRTFSKLTAAETELEAVLEILQELRIHPEVLSGKEAMFFKVRNALKQRPYQIVHFCGHAFFNERRPQQSALVLYDELMTTAVLASAFREHHPTLCFVNGCETARSGEGKDVAESDDLTDLQRSYSVDGLARPFLEAGAYLLGSRWRLDDQSAAQFAKTFYSSLLGDGLPIGKAITQARREVYRSHRDSLAWASYVYYGDPRVQFTPVSEQATVVSPQVPARIPAQPDELVAQRAQLARKVQEYEAIRSTEPSGPQRTGKLETTVTEAVNAADEANYREHLNDLLTSSQDASEGDRMVAFGLIQRHPDPQYADFVYEAIKHPRSAFEQYHALVAARNMVDLLDNLQAQALREALVTVSADLGTDRALLARDVLGRLGPIGGDLEAAIDAFAAKIQQITNAILSREMPAALKEIGRARDGLTAVQAAAYDAAPRVSVGEVSRICENMGRHLDRLARSILTSATARPVLDDLLEELDCLRRATGQ